MAWIDDFKKTKYYSINAVKPGEYRTPAADFPSNFYTAQNYRPTTRPPLPPDVEMQQDRYGQLTPTERWMMGKLSGVSQSKIFQGLERFMGGPFGKALSYLDIPAEGVERTLGLFAQAQEAAQDPNKWNAFVQDLGSAWYAGNMFYNVQNLPTFSWQGNKPTGVQIPTALPGVAGLVKARGRIEELVNQGMTYGQATLQAKEEMYDDLDALSFRSELYDTYGHILLDPMNFIMPALRPVERISAAGKAIRSFNWADDFIEESRDVLNIAAQSGDWGKVWEQANKAADVIPEVTRDALRAAEQAGDMRKATTIVEDLIGQHRLTRTDKALLFLTGGDQFAQPSTKAGQLLRKVNPFSLTPASRAYEYTTVISDNVGNLLRTTDDPVEIASKIGRAAQGAVGQDFGHAFMTLEGRYAQGAMGALDTHTRNLLAAQQLATQNGTIPRLYEYANALGMTPGELGTRLQAGDVAGVAQKLGVNPQELEKLGANLDGVAYTPELFKLEVMNKAIDIAAEQGIALFGVKQAGVLTKWSHMLKSAETLAFLRLNPGYMTRNVVNNEMTMLARGLFGWIPHDEIEKIWTRVGFTPERMGQGFGAIGEVMGVKGGKEGTAKIIEALRGEKGYLDKVSDAFSRVNLGKLDMGAVSANFEKKASMRAFTNGYMQGMKRYYWNKRTIPKPNEIISPQNMDAIARIKGNDIWDTISHAAADSLNPKEIDQKLAGNLNISLSGILEDAEKQLGTRLDDLFGDEFVYSQLDGLPEAVAKGQTREYLAGVKQKVIEHYDELAKKEIADYEGYVFNKVSGMGDQGVVDVYNELLDNFIGSHVDYALEQNMLNEKLSQLTDFDTKNRFWKEYKDVSRRYWDNHYDRMDAGLKGIRKGSKKAGIEVPEQIEKSFATIKKGYRTAFKKHDAELDTFFTEWLEKKPHTKTFEQIKADFDEEYARLTAVETAEYRKMNEAMAKSIKNPDVRDRFLAVQQEMGNLRQADKERVMAFYDEIKGLSPDEVRQRYLQFWNERYQRMEEMRALDKTGKAAMQGQPEAIAAIDELPVPSVKEVQPPSGGAMEKWLQGQPEGMRDAMEKSSESMIKNKQYAAFVPKGGPQPNDIAKYEAYRELLSSKGYIVGDYKHYPKSGTMVASVVDYRTASRSELPEVLSDAMEKGAMALRNDLSGAGVELVPGTEAGQFIRTSTNPDWYIELYNRGFSRKSVESALDRIIKDRGKDVPRGNDQTLIAIKDLITDQMVSGTDEFPPSPAALLLFNQPDAAAEALVQYLNSSWAANATDEDWIELVGSKENLDMLLNRMDEINEGRLPAQGILEPEGVPAPPPTTPIETAAEVPAKAFVGDLDQLVPPPLPIAQAQMDIFKTKGLRAFDAVEQAALERAKRPPMIWDDLPADLKQSVNGYINHIKNKMGESQYAATRFAEFRRDAALLNYNRRFNYNTWLGVLAPFEFWMTQSMAKWALHSIDRPAMLTTFLRMRKMMEGAGLTDRELPSRLRGQLQVKMPFLPDWMGDRVFVDPMRLMLPFDQMIYPYEEWQNNQSSAEGRASSYLYSQVEAGKITEQQAQDAINTQTGTLWDEALAKVYADDPEVKNTSWDFVNMITPFHAPIIWAKETLDGTPENIGPFSPLSRTLKGAAGLLGIDWDNSPINIEGRVRKHLGLPAFDKWDDYRVDRMLSNMAAMGEISADAALRAQIDRSGPAYEEAVKKANVEFAGGNWMSFLLKQLGLPVSTYPEGEKLQRSLNDDYANAWKMYEAGEPEALNNFENLHPEYASRLALWKKPEERLQTFLTDNLWDQWMNKLTKLEKDTLSDQLGEDFQTKFLNKETRNVESIPIETLQIWLKLMGGDPPGTLNSEVPKFEMPSQEVSWQAQTFYDTRNQYFPEYWKLQDAYYALPQGNQRRAYLRTAQGRQLLDYWDWKNDWMHRNPEAVPWLTDSYEFEYPNQQVERTAQQEGPWFTANEWRQALGVNLYNLAVDYVLRDQPLTSTAQDQLDQRAEKLGISQEELLGMLEDSLR